MNFDLPKYVQMLLQPYSTPLLGFEKKKPKFFNCLYNVKPWEFVVKISFTAVKAMGFFIFLT